MNQVKYLSHSNDELPLESLIETLQGISLLPVFSAQARSFIEHLSKSLLKDARCKQYPELIALGFWLRKGNLKKLTLQQGFGTAFDSASHDIEARSRKPLGIAVHFTPANVDTMFIYSWVTALLLGNCNIVRVASKDSDQQNLLLEIITQLFSEAEHQDIANRNYFITYSKDGEGTSILCAHADARLIWGGDTSVAAILSHSAAETCVDLCFADKFSATILANMEDNIDEVAQLMWRDTQPYLQQACSSPRLIYCVLEGKADKTQLQNLLLKLNQYAKNNSQSGWYSVSQANEHLVTAQHIMARDEREARELCDSQTSPELLVHASVAGLLVADVHDDMLELHTGNGFFICKICDSVEMVFDDIAKLNNSKLQTLSYYKLAPDELLKQKQGKSILGIDRIVPLGQALDFSFYWDGYDLLHELSRATAIVEEKNAH
ncbi:MAG: hypothetical protein ACI9O6_001949 [Glaciecola sp.]|jgi:hypothetical protein